MSFSFASVGHFFASVAQDVVKISKVTVPIVAKLEEAAPTIELVSGLIYPEASAIERGAFALLGMASQAVQDAGDTAASSGVNLSLDKQTIADIQALIPAIEAYAKQFGVAKPVAQATTQPASTQSAQHAVAATTASPIPFATIPVKTVG